MAPRMLAAYSLLALTIVLCGARIVTEALGVPMDSTLSTAFTAAVTATLASLVYIVHGNGAS